MRRSFGRRRVATVVAAAMLLTGVTAASAGLAPTLVKGGAGNQNSPTANATLLGYSENSRARPRHFDAFVEPIGGGARTKVNSPRTVGYMGHMNGDSGELAFQQIRRSSEVLLYETSSQTRSQPPNGVNTRLWEWSPSISDGFLLFGRNSFRRLDSPWKVVLFDRTMGTSTVLDSVTYRCGCIWPGQVTDQYATWTRCTRNACNVFYYDIVGGGPATRVPNPSDRFQYFGGVSGNTGSIVFMSSRGCGNDPRIMRWNPVGGGSATLVSTLPQDYDLGDTMYVYADGMHDDLFFTQAKCSRAFPMNIYKIDDVDLAGGTADSGRPESGADAPRLPAPGATPRG